MSPAKKNKKEQSKKKPPSKKKSHEDSEPNVDRDGLGELVKRKWKVFRVSPLHNFSVNRFRFYEKKINEGMNSMKKMMVTYKCRFSLIENLKLNGEENAEGIQVEVVRDDCQRVYLGHFISWNPAQDATNASVTYPILLVDAREDDTRGVHQLLCKLFDCDVQAVTFSFYALISFLVKLLDVAGSSLEGPSAQVSLEYKVPQCGPKDRIKVCLLLEETVVVLAVVMESLQEKLQDISTMEIIWEFYNKILNHIYHVYKMDLILAELYKINFPDAFITADGQIKMSTGAAAASALNVLREFTPLDAVTNF